MIHIWLPKMDKFLQLKANWLSTYSDISEFKINPELKKSQEFSLKTQTKIQYFAPIIKKIYSKLHSSFILSSRYLFNGILNRIMSKYIFIHKAKHIRSEIFVCLSLPWAKIRLTCFISNKLLIDLHSYALKCCFVYIKDRSTSRSRQFPWKHFHLWVYVLLE